MKYNILRVRQKYFFVFCGIKDYELSTMIMLVVLKGNPIQRQLISANLSAGSDFEFGSFVGRVFFWRRLS